MNLRTLNITAIAARSMLSILASTVAGAASVMRLSLTSGVRPMVWELSLNQCAIFNVNASFYTRIVREILEIRA